MGTVLAGRYRIVGLLGKGGMGEVYRADDLKLGQTVALKFLPERLADRADALSRFHNEVRVARQITHPNVCRVFDIGESDGMHFLSMEYIDGEDLASLLRRIGRLPSDKATEIARQLCAGLNAAHEIGVLHRDLKPANIMLDGRGKARITDFGLAGLTEEFGEGDRQVGTPAYMAPEQLSGKELSVQTDLYSLGLVLYEIFTGKRLYDAGTLSDLIRQHDEKALEIPESLSTEIDPSVERVILRCLEEDPGSRPHSVAQVFAALPGGDPLAAALAAGETPSPELIAASGKEGALRPAQAVIYLVAVLISLVFLLLLSANRKLHGLVKLDKPPAVLVDRAQTIIRNFGYEGPPVDTASGFDLNTDYYLHLGKQENTGTDWRSLIAGGQPLTYYFWYRQSPKAMIPNASPVVSYSNPPVEVPGMINLSLDPNGRLTEFRARPPEKTVEGILPEPDWKLLFTAAGMDIDNFAVVNSEWTPPDFADRHVAWSGAYPDHPDMPVRVEAAAFLGKPTYFRIFAPWTNAGGEWSRQAGLKIQGFLLILSTLAGAFLAYRNFRSGRGDRKGAFRLFFFSFSVLLLAEVLRAHHVGDFYAEHRIFLLAVAKPLLFSAVIWLFYIALEPYIRRLWPRLMISWSRLLSGCYRDPMVGRDVLIGCLFGTVQMAAFMLGGWFREKFHFGGDVIDTTWAPVVLGSKSALFGNSLESIVTGMSTSLFFLLLLLVSYALFRRRWAAIVFTWLLVAFWFGLTPTGEAAWLWMMAIVASALFVFAISRFGLLTMAAYMACLGIVVGSPVTSDFSRWYAVDGLIALSIVLVLAFVSFQISLAGQPLMRRGLIPD